MEMVPGGPGKTASNCALELRSRVCSWLFETSTAVVTGGAAPTTVTVSVTLFGGLSASD